MPEIGRKSLGLIKSGKLYTKVFTQFNFYLIENLCTDALYAKRDLGGNTVFALLSARDFLLKVYF